MRAKVIDSARELGVDLNVRRLPDSASWPDDAAAAVGCGRSRVASCAVFVADGDPILCIVSGDCPVDRDLLADALDVAELRPATSGEVRAATGFAHGAVPPLGHDLPIVLDAPLLAHTTVWMAGGDSHSVVEIEPARLVSCTSATVAMVTAVTA